MKEYKEEQVIYRKHSFHDKNKTLIHLKSLSKYKDNQESKPQSLISEVKTNNQIEEDQNDVFERNHF